MNNHVIPQNSTHLAHGASSTQSEDIYEAYSIEVAVQNSSGCIQAAHALHTREQMAQSSNCSIYNELNGTPDWNCIGDFTHETSNEVKRHNQIQFDDKLQRSIEAATQSSPAVAARQSQ